MLAQEYRYQMHKNHSKLRNKIEYGSLGLPPPQPLGEEGPDLYYFLLSDDTFALMPWLVKPYSRRQLTKEQRMGNYSIFRSRRVVENAFGILASRISVLLDTGALSKSCQRHCFDLCCVAQHAGDTPGQSRQGNHRSR